MIKVKLTFPHTNYPIIKLTPCNSGRWGNYQFYINDDIAECDYWVVFNYLLKPVEQTKCSPDNTIFISGEPSSVFKYDHKYLSQFARVITCQRGLKHPQVKYYLQGQPWFLGFVPDDYSASFNRSYDDLSQQNLVPKTKKISIITSNKLGTAGHRKRYEFALALKQHFGSALDLYGRGLQDFKDKWEVLAPYQYSIAIENTADNDYITEKLYDCFLAHCFPFYFGAPNVKQYFPAEAYHTIDINDLPGSIKTIETILNDHNHYQRHLASVLAAKNLCLHDYNLFGLIANYLDSQQFAPEAKQLITIKQDIFSFAGLFYKLTQRFYWGFNKLIRIIKNIHVKINK